MISFDPFDILVVISCQTGMHIVVYHYVWIIRALSSWESQDTKQSNLKMPKDSQYNGHKRDTTRNTTRQNSTQNFFNDLATRTHRKIWVDLMFSGKLRLSFVLVAPVMLFLNNKNNMWYWNRAGHHCA